MDESTFSPNPLTPIILRYLSCVTAHTPYEALIYVGGVNVDVNTAHKGGYKSKNNNFFNKTDIFPK